MTNYHRRLAGIRKALVGRTVRVELLAGGKRPENDPACEVYIPIPEYGIALWLDKQTADYVESIDFSEIEMRIFSHYYGESLQNAQAAQPTGGGQNQGEDTAEPIDHDKRPAQYEISAVGNANWSDLI